MNISEYTKLHEYWYALVGALIALLFAYVEYLRARRKNKNEVRKGLLSALAYNQQLTRQAFGQLEKRESVPNYPMDYQGLSDWNARARGLISEETFQRIHGLAYQLHHFSQVLEKTTPSGLFEQARTSEHSSLMLRCKNVEVWILEAQVEVERSLRWREEG